jgi:hypothetical protein
MSVRLSGGLGPLRVSIPLLPRRRRRGGGSSGAGMAALLAGCGKLLWWMLLYCCYWPMRLVYWELPRLIWQEVQRRRAASAVAPHPGGISGP